MSPGAGLACRADAGPGDIRARAAIGVPVVIVPGWWAE